jgi:hypothetical protein
MKVDRPVHDWRQFTDLSELLYCGLPRSIYNSFAPGLGPGNGKTKRHGEESLAALGAASRFSVLLI